MSFLNNSQLFCFCFIFIQELNTLIFTGISERGGELLVPIGHGKLLKRFPQLEVLDISRSTANDDCMSVIGINCPQLKYVS